MNTLCRDMALSAHLFKGGYLWTFYAPFPTFLRLNGWGLKGGDHTAGERKRPIAPNAGIDPRDRKTVTIIHLAYSESHLNRIKPRMGAQFESAPTPTSPFRKKVPLKAT